MCDVVSTSGACEFGLRCFPAFSGFYRWNADAVGNVAHLSWPRKVSSSGTRSGLYGFSISVCFSVRSMRVRARGVSQHFFALPTERRCNMECRTLELPLVRFHAAECASGFAARTHGDGKKCGASPCRAAPSFHPAARFQQSKPPQTGTAFPYILMLQSSYSNVPAP